MCDISYSLCCRGVGRPLLDIDVTYIEYLRGLRFTFTDIAKIMGISRTTIYRRLDDAGIDHARTSYTNISDAALDQAVRTIKQVHPNDGERLMAGHLASRGIIVQRARLRGSIHRTDPENTAIRRSVAVRRRVYSPNCVWHLDGHHKLIRWMFVTHGAIDGYSRTFVFLKCADNNRASTVLSAFVEAAHIHGLPERVRTDHGGENIEVWRFIVDQHGSASSVIAGSSTHNERIERLWRDVYRCVVSIMFFNLESENPGNEIDLYCLHFIYLPRINSALESFVESWNNHPISTETNMTPNQLFVRGALEHNLTPQQPRNVQPGTASTGNVPLPQVSSAVTVPLSHFTPCAALTAQVAQNIAPLASSDDFGYALYCETVDIVGRHLQIGCNNCLVRM